MPRDVATVNAVWSAGQSAVVGTIEPAAYDRRLVLAAITGPANSVLTVYRGRVLTPSYMLTRVFPADSRTYDSTMGDAPILVAAGEACTWAWTDGASGVGVTATASITFQWGRD